jgi:uncharacterized protein (DUF952 family)
MSSKYVFKIVTALPDLNSTKLGLTELDQQSGFIHLSTGPQIAYTCNRYFSSVETLFVLKFPYEKIKKSMKWEPAPGSSELFPHLYSDLLIADMDSTREFQKEQGSWVDVLGRDSWLFDGAEEK